MLNKYRHGQQVPEYSSVSKFCLFSCIWDIFMILWIGAPLTQCTGLLSLSAVQCSGECFILYVLRAFMEICGIMGTRKSPSVATARIHQRFFIRHRTFRMLQYTMDPIQFRFCVKTTNLHDDTPSHKLIDHHVTARHFPLTLDKNVNRFTSSALRRVPGPISSNTYTPPRARRRRHRRCHRALCVRATEKNSRGDLKSS